MGSEILAIPEEHLPHVIEVLRAGWTMVAVPTEVKNALEYWCNLMDDTALPNVKSPCILTTCVYCESGVCSDPDCNSGNGDASCFSFSKHFVFSNLLKKGEV